MYILSCTKCLCYQLCVLRENMSNLVVGNVSLLPWYFDNHIEIVFFFFCSVSDGCVEQEDNVWSQWLDSPGIFPRDSSHSWSHLRCAGLFWSWWVLVNAAFFKKWRILVLFVGSLIPLFWTFGDVCPGLLRFTSVATPADLCSII